MFKTSGLARFSKKSVNETTSNHAEIIKTSTRLIIKHKIHIYRVFYDFSYFYFFDFYRKIRKYEKKAPLEKRFFS
jgi:hypothetical protein